MNQPTATMAPAGPGPGWLGAVLDELDYGILIVVEGRLAHINRTARAQLAEAACALTLQGRTVRATQAGDDNTLQAALGAAHQAQRRQMLTLRGAAQPLHLAVVPLSAGSAADGADGVMIVLGKRGICPELSAHWFCRSHQLTPAESNVLLDLLAGLQPRAIAGRQGVALSTVRSQIASIKGKTSVRDVRHLLLAAAALPPVVPTFLRVVKVGDAAATACP
jgi:DNA-binding CsgD family transcriptional regulator